MRFFIGQAVTGEDINEINRELVGVYSSLESAGHTLYDTLRESSEERQSKREKMEYAFKEIDDSDAFLAIVRSERRSEGMLMEAGYALSQGKELVLAVREGVDTSLRSLADRVIEYKTSEELSEMLRAIGQKSRENKIVVHDIAGQMARRGRE